jgi:hypothetical protein
METDDRILASKFSILSIIPALAHEKLHAIATGDGQENAEGSLSIQGRDASCDENLLRDRLKECHLISYDAVMASGGDSVCQI